MKRFCWSMICFLLILSIIAGCDWNQNVLTGKNANFKPIRIGLAMATLQEERWRRDRDYFAERAKQLGAELFVQNANANQEQQNNQVAYLLRKGIDVLVIVPDDLNQAAEAVQMARKAGVVVISYDRLVRNAELNLYISFDNIKVGEFMAEYLVNKVPRGDYVIINGAPSDNNCAMFNQGYKNILNPYIQENKINIIFEGWAKGWKPEYAYQSIQNLLSKHRKFDAVIAANDSLASAVIEALSEWRLAGKVPVVGHDADLSGCQRIVEGTQLMTVYKPIRQLAYRAADMAIALASHKLIKTNAKPIFNGKHMIPSEIITPVPLDKDNIDIVIKDGYHPREEIYLNVTKSKP